FLHTNLPKMLDCMSVAGCAGIAVGRLASLFNSSDRGQVVENFKSLPFVYPVTNAVSGAVEYRLATFMLQSMVALVLFGGLALFYLRKDPAGRRKDGDVALIFLLIYGASQVVLDSTRYDSLFFRSNGFVSVVQVLGALGLALAIIAFSRRMVKVRGFEWWQILLWVFIAAGIGCGGFMEYYVQRRGNEAVFAYSVMSGCLIGVILLTLLIRYLAIKKE
ncbi:MAG: prolipoprotein diacylglyceryl transferase family protein, partial [Oscillospiraceae bacterium]